MNFPIPAPISLSLLKQRFVCDQMGSGSFEHLHRVQDKHISSGAHGKWIVWADGKFEFIWCTSVDVALLHSFPPLLVDKGESTRDGKPHQYPLQSASYLRSRDLQALPARRVTLSRLRPLNIVVNVGIGNFISEAEFLMLSWSVPSYGSEPQPCKSYLLSILFSD